MSWYQFFCELQWLTNILNELHDPFIKPSLLYCDNASTRHMTNNSSFHERTKHIELDCHLVREKLHLNLFHLLLVSSSQQTIDIFTKPLDLHPFISNLYKFGVQIIIPKLMEDY